VSKLTERAAGFGERRQRAGRQRPDVRSAGKRQRGRAGACSAAASGSAKAEVGWPPAVTAALDELGESDEARRDAPRHFWISSGASQIPAEIEPSAFTPPAACWPSGPRLAAPGPWTCASSPTRSCAPRWSREPKRSWRGAPAGRWSFAQGNRCAHSRGRSEQRIGAYARQRSAAVIARLCLSVVDGKAGARYCQSRRA
jgi:hypothetical protein